MIGRALGLVGLLAGASSLAHTAATQIEAPALVNPAWLSADSGSHLASLALIAGLTGANGALNFNGFHDGGLTVGVPLGWTVVLHFRNHDGMLPHSAEVIDEVHPLPVQPVTPAFPRAVTLRLAEGLVSEQTDDVRFVANKGGSYLIFCGVAGHGAAGMWIRLDVSDSARTPSLAATAAAKR